MKKQAKLSEHLALAGGVETSNHVTVDGRSACKQIIIRSIDEKKKRPLDSRPTASHFSQLFV
jgi:hypothetical protein